LLAVGDPGTLTVAIGDLGGLKRGAPWRQKTFHNVFTCEPKEDLNGTFQQEVVGGCEAREG
jgi:hypothetical protein